MNLTASILSHELQIRPRRRRFHVYRVLFILCGGVVTLVSIIVGISAGGSATGLVLFRNLSRLALIAACLLAILSSAFLFVQERRDGTLGLLMLTDITEGELLLSRLVSRLLTSSLALLSFLPLFIMLIGLGGVLSLQIIGAYAILLSATFVCSCMGILAASAYRTEKELLFFVCMAVLVVLVSLPIAVASFCDALSVGRSLPLSCVSSLMALEAIANPGKLNYVLFHVPIQLFLGLAFLLAARIVVRRNRESGVWALVEDNPKNGKQRKTGQRNQPNRVYESTNPVTRRDLNGLFMGMQFLRVYKWVVIGLFLTIGLSLGGFLLFKPARLDFEDVLMFSVILVVCAGIFLVVLFLLILMYYCSRGFSQEKRQRILELLFLSELSIRDIFLGKLTAVFRAFLPSFFWLIPACVVIMVFMFKKSGMEPFEYMSLSLGLFVNFMSACVAYSLLALALSLRFSRLVTLGICLVVFVLWNVLGRLFFMMVILGISSWGVTFALDFAFHLELVLIGSILFERLFKKMEQGGTLWYQQHEAIPA